MGRIIKRKYRNGGNISARLAQERRLAQGGVYKHGGKCPPKMRNGGRIRRRMNPKSKPVLDPDQPETWTKQRAVVGGRKGGISRRI